MKSNEHVIGEAVRIEYLQDEGRLYLVFEITDPQAKHEIKKNWTQDMEYKILDKKLIVNND